MEEDAMSRLRHIAHDNLPTLMKTATYYVIHVCVGPRSSPTW